MNLEIINPIEIPDWDSLLLRNGDYSFFHSSAWAKALKKSYGCDPVYFASIEASQISLLMPFMNVVSPLTGRRGVSLPFTDQCAPFYLRKEFLRAAVERAIDFGKEAGWKYIEWRDTDYFYKELSPWEVYYTHNLNLKRTESELFSSLKDSNQMNINKAIREGVSIKIGRSLGCLKSFYRLNCRTRRRHGLPPSHSFSLITSSISLFPRDMGLSFLHFIQTTWLRRRSFFISGRKLCINMGLQI